MKTLVCLLEEPSAREMLKAVLPKIIPSDVKLKYIVFEGKQDLEKQLIKKLKHWKLPDSFFLVMRDQDSANCTVIKSSLLEKIKQTEKAESTLVRIACHELESFYLGDLNAVEQGLKINGISKMQNKKKFRDPDQLANAAEELSKLSKQYQKISGSRAIAPFLDIDGANKSTSFNMLVNGVKSLLNKKVSNETIGTCKQTQRSN